MGFLGFRPLALLLSSFLGFGFRKIVWNPIWICAVSLSGLIGYDMSNPIEIRVYSRLRKWVVFSMIKSFDCARESIALCYCGVALEDHLKYVSEKKLAF
ncbi:hypothetical protein M5689_009593 [Euphorbia peplus]|nr:hypothetical protein M5689_009593 [Euphorbia peplus]